MTKAIYAATAEYEAEIKQLPMKRQVSVSRILLYLGVSRSGYNVWKHRMPSNAERRREEVKRMTQEIYDESHQNYGAPKITAILRKSGITISEKTVGNYMRRMGIKAQWVKPYTRTTMDSDFGDQLQNILNEQFNLEHPNAVWVSDITYIWTLEGFVYLTSIMDLFSRKIIAWVLSDTLEAKHVIETIEKAKECREVTQPLVFHSDKGCQYVSEAFRNATAGMRLTTCILYLESTEETKLLKDKSIVIQKIPIMDRKTCADKIASYVLPISSNQSTNIETIDEIFR